MNLKTLIMFTILVAMSQNVVAKNWINIHVASKHERESYQDGKGNEIHYNENNFGIGFSYSLVSYIDAKGGFFKNSYNKTSWYAGLDMHTSYNNLFAVGIDVGAATGYDETPVSDTKIVPIAMPHLSLIFKNFKFQLGYIPPVSPKLTSVLTFSVSISL